MAHVFLSHAGQDGELAGDVARWLLGAGHDVFLDQDVTHGITAGDDWEERLHAQLRRADAVVCLVTGAFVRSTWCTGEVAVARTHGCRLLPIRVEPGAEHPFLTGVQHVDLADGDRAWAKLLEGLRRVDAVGGGGWPPDRSPYPGLRPFTADQHQVFFGRSTEINELAGLLRSPVERAATTLLLVVGPSGCGKSSLVRAGLLPLMSDEPGWWALPPMLPGTDPVGALARELAAGLKAVGSPASVADVRHRLERDGLAAMADEVLHAAPGPRRHRLLLVVDQFEELLSQSAARDRARFAELLRPAAGRPVQVVATIRPEFLDQLLRSPELAGLPAHTYTVRPLPDDALAEVIERPARLAGIAIDDGLVTRLVSDTDGGEALPLLAYTLAELAEGVERGGRLLLSRYEQLGGVQGTLARQADAALDAAATAGGRNRQQIVRGLLALVTVDEHGRPTRRRVPLAELPAAELEPFIVRRLLTSDGDERGAVVEVAHEAIMSAWTPLARAVAADSVALRARREVEQAADAWSAAGSPPDRLWERGQLAAAVAETGVRTVVVPRPAGDAATRPWPRRGLVTDRVELSGRAVQFLQASLRRDRRRRARSTTVLASLLILAVVAAGVALVQLRDAGRQQRIATSRLLMSQADATVARNPRAALQIGAAAAHLDPNDESRAALARILGSTRYAGSLDGHASAVRDVAFTRDGRALATAGEDATVILWDLVDPARPQRSGRPLTGHVGSVNALAFAPDGAGMATAGADRTLILWDVTDRSSPRRIGQPLAGHEGEVADVAFSPDGQLLASVGADSTLILWDLADPARPRRLGTAADKQDDGLVSVAFAPDGRTVVTAGGDSVMLWDVTDPADPRRLPRLPDRPVVVGDSMAVTFSPDGRTLAFGAAATVGLWDVTDLAHPRSLTSLDGPVVRVTALAFSPDGRRLAAADAGATVNVWDTTAPALARRDGVSSTGHANYITALAFAPDGKSVATAGRDRTTMFWSLADDAAPPSAGPPLRSGPCAVRTLAFSPLSWTRRLLATAGTDPQAVLWDLDDPALPTRIGPPLAGQTGQLFSVAFSPDGHTLATAGADTTIVLWDVRDPARPVRAGAPLLGHTDAVHAVTFSPDGRTLASVGADNAVVLWDVGDPAHPQRIGSPLTDHTGQVHTVAFSPDGRILATGGADTTARLWDVTDRAHPVPSAPPLAEHSAAVYSVAFSPDGRTLATGSADRTAILWDVGDPAHPQRIGLPIVAHTNQVVAVTFAPDGKTLATAGLDSTTRLWNVADPARPRQIGQVVSGGVLLLWSAFSPDGRTLAVANGLAIERWDVTALSSITGRALTTACRITRGGLDPVEWARSVPGLPYEDSCAQP